jgi:acyl-coenzyme A synthetase/AMP-(fatty) acid ligase
VRKLLGASRRRLPVWVQTWGQSEAGPVAIRPYVLRSLQNRGRRMPATRDNGWPTPFFSKVRSVDPDTLDPLPRGEVGLIEVSQPGRCLDYMGERDRWERKRRGDWWNTGDLGVISRSRSVRLVDREIDRIPGGESAIELEDVLLDRLPQTTEVVVLAAADGPPVPIVSTVGDAPVRSDDWDAATADLPPLASPHYMPWDEIPRTATWKVRRPKLREQVLPDAAALGYGYWT